MPELPEVECVAAELRCRVEGQDLTGVTLNPESNFKGNRNRFKSSEFPLRVTEIKRRGKWIRWQLARGMEIWIHLGMTGQFFWCAESAAWTRHDHLSFRFQNHSQELRYRDIRKFGNIHWMVPGAARPLGLERVALDPFEVDSEDFLKMAQKHQGAVKALLLNQRFLSGLGNIYANESLFRAGIRPMRRADRIRNEEWARLHQEIRAVLSEAIRRGGSSIDDYVHTDGSRGSFQKQHRVYNRFKAPCRVCGSLIRRKVIAGRSSFYCYHCQK